jgi:hypothetical protein
MAMIGVQRLPDGRHAVMMDGRVMGAHKSIWSAARQIHDYLQGDNVEGAGENDTSDEGEGSSDKNGRPMPDRPKRDAPVQDRKPKIPRERIPRP